MTLTEYSIKVSEIPVGTTELELRKLFWSRFKTVTDIYLPAKYSKYGIGFVRFSTVEDAQTAAHTENFVINGSTLKCELATCEKKGGRTFSAFVKEVHVPNGDPNVGTQELGAHGRGRGRGFRRNDAEFSVWVYPILEGTTSDDLIEALAGHGIIDITDAYVPTGKGYGFVRFPSYVAAQLCVEACVDLMVNGAPATLQLATAEKRSVGLDKQGGGGKPQKAAAPCPGEKLAEVSVKLGNLAPSTTGDQIVEALAFEQIDKMTDIYIPPAKNFGFVRFKDHCHAKELLSLGSLDVNGNKLTIEPAEGPKRSSDEMHKNPQGDGQQRQSSPRNAGPVRGITEVSVKIGNLAPGTTSDDVLNDLAMEFITTMTDCYIPEGKNYGFLRFAREAEAQQVLELVGFTVNGSVLTFEPAEGHKRSADDMHKSPQGSIVGHDAPAVGVSGRADKAAPSSQEFGRGRSGDSVAGSGSVTIGGSTSSTDVYRDPSGNQVFGESVQEGRHKIRNKAFPARGAQGYGVCSKPMPNELVLMPDDGTSKDGESKDAISIKVGNLPDGCTGDDLCDAFSAHGIEGMTDSYVPTGKRFGFVRFSTVGEGQEAMKRLIVVGGRIVNLELATASKRNSEDAEQATPQPAPAPPRAHTAGAPPADPNVSASTPSLKVSDLPHCTTPRELHMAFVTAGCTSEIIDVYVPKGDRGYGFVRFSTPDMAVQAMALSVLVRGRKVPLDLSVKVRKVRPGGPQ